MAAIAPAAPQSGQSANHPVAAIPTGPDAMTVFDLAAVIQCHTGCQAPHRYEGVSFFFVTGLRGEGFSPAFRPKPNCLANWLRRSLYADAVMG